MSLPPLSVVVPIYNESGNVTAVLHEIHSKLAGHFDLEIIAVDDGSDDGTAEELAQLSGEISGLKVVRHVQRSGKSAGLRTGMLAARGPWVATIDGDGQNDPDDIANMVAHIDPRRVGAVGLVAGVRKRRNDGASRWLASRLANGLRKALLRDDCPDTACGLKLIPRDVFLALPFFDAVHRFMPALVRHIGFETRIQSVSDRPRGAGQSKYTNLGRAFAGAVDLLGVIWLMRRTSVPAPEQVLGAENGNQIQQAET